MADEGRSRLGRGLAALIGDVGGDITITERARTQRRVPIEYLKPNPRNPRRQFGDAELDDLAASIRQRGHHSAGRGPCGAREERRLRDHRRRAALAGGATRRPARYPDRAARSDRQRGARACNHRERTAQRSQSSGGGRRLSGAGERVQSQSRGHRQDRRQEPQPCQQYAAPAEAAGVGQDLYQCRQDHRRRRAHARRSGRSGANGARDRKPAGSMSVRSRRSRRGARKERARRSRNAHSRMPIRWRSSGGCRMRLA